jgi:hypothetical protein
VRGASCGATVCLDEILARRFRPPIAVVPFRRTFASVDVCARASNRHRPIRVATHRISYVSHCAGPYAARRVDVCLLSKSHRAGCALWPGQSHALLTLIFLFALVVGLGWGVFCLFLPAVGKMLLGIQSVFNLSTASMLNTTFIMAMVVLTYLSVDPLLKAIFVLRCFYGESLQSGDDLRAELQGFRMRSVAVLLLAGTICFNPIAAPAQEPTPGTVPSQAPSAPPTGVPPSDLDRAINDVIHKRKYTWRSPREKILKTDKAGEKSAFARWLEGAWDWTRERIKGVFEWIGRMLQKIFGRTRGGGTPSTGISLDQIRGLLIVLLALALGVTVFFIIRMWRKKHRRPAVIETEAIKPAPDLTDENVSAEQLPEDEWIKLARELLERGDLRLALRAFYLSSLAHLAQRNLISLAKFKSNREFERELVRRGHSFPSLLTLFGENLYTFDRTWYGMHEATRDVVQQFATNVEKIKAGG